jgi:hypothetical protein
MFETKLIRPAIFENNFFTKMCNGSEAGSCPRLSDFVHHSTLDSRVIKRERREHKAATRDMMGLVSIMKIPETCIYPLYKIMACA